MPVKKYKIKGRAARQKGSRAEIKVRNALRRIYPQEKRQRVQRVPLSGAAAIKGDVMDMNDPDTMYEVKNQETLTIPAWWRQTVREAGVRMPVLVVTQSWRPFYYLMRKGDWNALAEAAGMLGIVSYTKIKKQTVLFDTMGEQEPNVVGEFIVGDEELAVVPEQCYLDVKSLLLPGDPVQ